MFRTRVMRRLTTNDYAVDAVTAADAYADCIACCGNCI